MTKSLTDSLKARGPSFGEVCVHALARPQQLVEAAVDGQVEMRDGLLRQRQALRDHLAHAVVRHDLVGTLVVQRQDLVVRHALQCGRAAGAVLPLGATCRAGLGSRSMTVGERALDVALDDAAVRTRARQRARSRCRRPWPAGAPAARRRCARAGFGLRWRPTLRRPSPSFARSPLLASTLTTPRTRWPRPLPSAAPHVAWRSLRGRRLRLGGRRPRSRLRPAATAIGVLTFTPSVPASTSRRPTLPSSTASTSMVALSVSISAMMSPALTCWPSLMSHLASLPSSMVGDSAGIRISVGMASLIVGWVSAVAHNPTWLKPAGVGLRASP